MEVRSILPISWKWGYGSWRLSDAPRAFSQGIKGVSNDSTALWPGNLLEIGWLLRLKATRRCLDSYRLDQWALALNAPHKRGCPKN
jgi:hypothetical protein